VLVFAIITLVKLRQGVVSAMLDVFLPVLLLMPAIYFLRIPHIPLISCYGVVLLPLAIAALCRYPRNWRFQRADLWVLGYALAGIYTDYINLGIKDALYNLFEPGFLGGVFAYVIGKLMIEQTGCREQFVKRLAILLAAVGFLSISEFTARRNLFVAATHRFFGYVDYWRDQYRAGFLRIKGPFMGAEEAGIVFLIGFFLAVWLWFLNRNRGGAPEQKYWGVNRSTLCLAGILLGLCLTLSRGPMLGVAAGFLIARIGMEKNQRLAWLAALVLLSVGSVVAHQRTVLYSQAASAGPASGDSVVEESKASAAYRTRLYQIYEPVAEAGGLFGWSGSIYQRVAAEYNPEAASFWSIDNEYLLLWVAQGKVGLTLFIFIVAEGVIALVRAVLSSQQATDTCFYYCLGGMLAGLVLVLMTVFLAGQGSILFFLCSGWIQSLPDKEWVPRSARQFNFRWVIT
jgi:hypothetical protein